MKRRGKRRTRRSAKGLPSWVWLLTGAAGLFMLLRPGSAQAAAPTMTVPLYSPGGET